MPFVGGNRFLGFIEREDQGLVIKNRDWWCYKTGGVGQVKFYPYKKGRLVGKRFSHPKGRGEGQKVLG